MRTGFALLATLALCSSATSQNHVKKQVPPPDQFEIGLFTFFDFGPPFNYYQVYLVRRSASGTKVERLIFTPEGNKCLAPARLETASATLQQSLAELLGSKNPCAIPEKDLKREIKRCKKCSVFSGSKVTMQVTCGGAARLIRSDILDRDMFGAAAHTPENTAWTMQLLEKLDKPLGPGVMDKPMFADVIPASRNPHPSEIEADAIRDVEQGKFDILFPSASVKLADLYRETQKPAPPPPTAELKSPLPIMSEIIVEPDYPRLAKMTHTEGDVTFAFEVDSNGLPTGLNVIAGHPLLQAVVKEAVAKWRFSAAAAGQKIQATIQFAINCPK